MLTGNGWLGGGMPKTGTETLKKMCVNGRGIGPGHGPIRFASGRTIDSRIPKEDMIYAHRVVRKISPDAPIRMLYPKARPDVLRFGLYRDPFDWYCSLYSHLLSRSPYYDDTITSFCRGEPGFRSFLKGATSGEVENTDVRFLMKLPDEWARSLKGPTGLYSLLFEWVYGDGVGGWGVHLWIKTAQLLEGLQTLGIEARECESVNTRTDRDSDGMPDNYQDWYDNEMMSWVEKDYKWVNHKLANSDYSSIVLPAASTRWRRRNTYLVQDTQDGTDQSTKPQSGL